MMGCWPVRLVVLAGWSMILNTRDLNDLRQSSIRTFAPELSWLRCIDSPPLREGKATMTSGQSKALPKLGF